MQESTLKQKLHNKIEALSAKYPNLMRVLRSGGDRAVLFMALSMLIGLLFCVYNAVLAGVYHAIWNAVLAGYYFLLLQVKVAILFGVRRTKKSDNPIKDDIVAYLVSGIMMLIMHTAVVFLVINVNRGESFKYDGLIIYGYALYAFCKIIAAIVNLVKTKKQKLSLVVQSVRNINIADALISILALQTAMISAFGELGNANIITGSVICGIVMLGSTYMIIRAIILLKRLRRNGSGQQPQE